MPRFWHLLQSQALEAKTHWSLCFAGDGIGWELVISVFSLNGLLLFPCHAGSLGTIVKLLIFLSMCTMWPSLSRLAAFLVGCLMWALPPSAPGTGSRPPSLLFFSKPRVLGKFGGTSSSCFLRLWIENLFPHGLGFYKTKTQKLWFALFPTLLCGSLEWERSDLVLEGQGGRDLLEREENMGNVEKGENEDLKTASSQTLGWFSIVPSKHPWWQVRSQMQPHLTQCFLHIYSGNNWHH